MNRSSPSVVGRVRRSNPPLESRKLHLVLKFAANESPIFAIRLKRASYLFGSGANCDIVILDHSVSRHHARVTVSGPIVSVSDLGSECGTFVDDEAVNTCQLRVGQVIRFGAMPYRLVLQDESSLPCSCPDDTGNGSETTLPPDSDLLTPAQLRVYDLLLDGTQEAAIGARLRLSVHTVHTHVKAIYSHLGVHSRAELFARQLKARRGR